MSLHRMLQARAAENNPLRIGLIGAGKFGAMYLSQIPTTPGIHLLGIADLSPARAKENLARLGWKPEVTAAGSFAEARRNGNTHLTDDWRALVSHPEIDIVVESTGDPIAAVEHALEAFRNGKSVVMVTVEADAFCGPLLAKRAAQAGVIYSLAYGDQPALICELVDWARTSGFEVTAAGRGHKWLPHYAQSTPETVWKYWGLNEEQARRGGLNPKMFNSFLDGSKPAIESTAVANATGLTPAPDGLAFPPCAVEDLPFVMRPASEGGQPDRGEAAPRDGASLRSSREQDRRAVACTSRSDLRAYTLVTSGRAVCRRSSQSQPRKIDSDPKEWAGALADFACPHAGIRVERVADRRRAGNTSRSGRRAVRSGIGHPRHVAAAGESVPARERTSRGRFARSSDHRSIQAERAEILSRRGKVEHAGCSGKSGRARDGACAPPAYVDLPRRDGCLR
jgi:hypothetical protein